MAQGCAPALIDTHVDTQVYTLTLVGIHTPVHKRVHQHQHSVRLAAHSAVPTDGPSSQAHEVRDVQGPAHQAAGGAMQPSGLERTDQDSPSCCNPGWPSVLTSAPSLGPAPFLYPSKTPSSSGASAPTRRRNHRKVELGTQSTSSDISPFCKAQPRRTRAEPWDLGQGCLP